MSKNNSTNNLFLNQPVIQPPGNYTAAFNDVIIEVNTTAARTIILPAPSSAASTSNIGKFYVIKDITGLAATNNITINVFGGGTIDGVTSLVIGTNYGAIQVYTDGTSYYSQAFVTVTTVGTTLASASWRKISGSTFVPTGGQPTQSLTNIASPMATTGLVNFSTLTADHITNINPSTTSFTIVNPGLYLLSFDADIVTNSGNNTGTMGQIVKNGTTVISGAINAMLANFVSYLGGRVLTNLVAGDVIDVRFGSYNGFGFFFYSVEIDVQQLPTTF
ncbi:MAG: hypothetical protein ACRDDW_03270 [Candidatus Rhabdochlamydia sp.]